MHAIIFVQRQRFGTYFPGRPEFTIPYSDHVADKAKQIIAAGYRFECEILTTGGVSLTITDDEADHAIEVVPNGPGMGEAVDRLVLGFEVSR